MVRSPQQIVQSRDGIIIDNILSRISGCVNSRSGGLLNSELLLLLAAALANNIAHAPFYTQSHMTMCDFFWQILTKAARGLWRPTRQGNVNIRVTGLWMASSPSNIGPTALPHSLAPSLLLIRRIFFFFIRLLHFSHQSACLLESPFSAPKTSC